MGLVSVFLTLRSLMHHFPHWAGKKGLDIVGLSVHEDKGPGLLGKWLIPGGGSRKHTGEWGVPDGARDEGKCARMHTHVHTVMGQEKLFN